MQRQLTVERLEAIARQALLAGYGRMVTWSDHVRDPVGRPVKADPLGGRVRRVCVLRCSMDCEDPLAVELFARYSAEHLRRKKPITELS